MTRNKLDRARELFHLLNYTFKNEPGKPADEKRPELEEELARIERYFKFLIWFKGLDGKIEGNTAGCLPFTHYFLLYEELAIQKLVKIGESKNLAAGLLDLERIPFRLMMRWDMSTPEGNEGYLKFMHEGDYNGGYG